MIKFIAQFKLSPMTHVMFESFIYRVADKMIDGYNGGMWETKTVGKTVILLIPADGKVKLKNQLSGSTVETDQVTASAAFTYLVVNWFWNEVAGDISDKSNELFDKCFFAIRDAVYADNSEFDHSAFYNFTD